MADPVTEINKILSDKNNIKRIQKLLSSPILECGEILAGVPQDAVVAIIDSAGDRNAMAMSFVKLAVQHSADPIKIMNKLLTFGADNK